MNMVRQQRHGAGGRTDAPGGRWTRRRVAVSGLASCVLVLGVLAAQAAAPATARGHHSHHRSAFTQVNLVSDIEGMAQITDPALKNPWGLAFGPSTPAWVANNFNPASKCPESDPECIPAPEDLLTKITLYSGANATTPLVTKVPLEVSGSSPTGVVFNPTTSFVINQGGVDTPARFLFNETFLNSAGDAPEARITGWSNVPAPAPSTTSTDARKDPALHFGLALVPGEDDDDSMLLAADGVNGVIDVFDSKFQPVTTPGLFTDPGAAEDGLAPYNVTFLDGRVYVAYFNDPEAAGFSLGAVSVFKPDGRFKKRLVTSRKLEGPWGMAIAPDDWGRFGGRLLVGNVDNGKIFAFNKSNGHFRGTVRDAHGDPIVNPGIWGIAFGNGTIGTPRTLLFVAGVGEEVGGFGDEIYEHGLGRSRPGPSHVPEIPLTGGRRAGVA
jgi:uncharacterized protein (TIGR03118 family)